MNRKLRRASKHSGAVPPPFGSAARGLSDLFGAAVARHQAGAFADAERGFQEVLAHAPNHAGAHSRLGAVMIAQGKINEAIAHLERAVTLEPDLFEAHGNLTQAYMLTGQREPAIEAAARVVELRETPQTRTMFGQCVGFARFTADNARFRRLLLRALSEGWVRPRELTQACISLIKHNPAVKDGIARVNAVWPGHLGVAELFSPTAMAALSGDELLCCLLEHDPITDIGLERLLTNLRHNMLTVASADGTTDEGLLPLYCSVARQCFINEYVFALSDGEVAEAERLRASLEEALATAAPCPAPWVAATAAYFPLHTVAKAEALLDRPWPGCLQAVLQQQVQEPIEERRIATAIPTLTTIESDVSRAVRQQYEENPYPRWVCAGLPAPPAMLAQAAAGPLAHALIAGCGTGLSTIELARQAPRARILAIDLSLASLGYAKRIAQKFGLANVEFAQADIMRLATIERRFDFIDASGVLHHLADPWQGWRILLSLLRPGGTMQVGLYSELARKNVVAARALIAERGYGSSPQDIRHCRADIVSSADPLLKSVSHAADFFATSECRDLLFHVQEHRTTLPQIKAFLAANALQFDGFVLDALTLHTFRARFPQPAAMIELDYWHAYETEAPATFAAMYQFAVRKPAAPA